MNTYLNANSIIVLGDVMKQNVYTPMNRSSKIVAETNVDTALDDDNTTCSDGKKEFRFSRPKSQKNNYFGCGFLCFEHSSFQGVGCVFQKIIESRVFFW